MATKTRSGLKANKPFILLQLCASVEIDILFCQQLDGHIVDRAHFLSQHNGLEQRVYTAEALLIAVLGNDERDASLAQTLGVLGNHVVAHNLYVAAVVAQQPFADDVGS